MATNIYTALRKEIGHIKLQMVGDHARRPCVDSADTFKCKGDAFYTETEHSVTDVEVVLTQLWLDLHYLSRNYVTTTVDAAGDPTAEPEGIMSFYMLDACNWI